MEPSTVLLGPILPKRGQGLVWGVREGANAAVPLIHAQYLNGSSAALSMRILALLLQQ